MRRLLTEIEYIITRLAPWWWYRSSGMGGGGEIK